MIPLSRPNIRQEEVALVVDVINSGQLVQGEFVHNLETHFAELHGVPYAIAVSNGTAALHLSMLAMGIGLGDEVIVTAYSFVASANSIVLAGATPVFCDTQEDYVNMDVHRIQSLFTKRTKAILVVHEFGFPAEIESILEIAALKGVPVIEDAACALGSTKGQRRLGTFGALASFSFHPRKLITSGEGGIVVTSDIRLATYLRSMRNHGLDVESQERKYSRAGFNYRMSDISAALLLPQLSRLEEIVNLRNGIAQRYRDSIINPRIEFLALDPDAINNWQTFPILLENESEANRFIDFMGIHGFGAIRPAQLIPSEPYFKALGWVIEDFPNASALHSRAVALPMFELMTDIEISSVIEACNDF